MNTVLLAASINVKKEFINIFNEKLYILVKNMKRKMILLILVLE